jgi:hypothetical protein
VRPSNERPLAHRTRTLSIALVAGLGFVATACGPILSTQALQDAENAIVAAEAAEAERLAIYEFVSAVEYFGKAREEWGYSDFRAARDYARRAADFARQARDRAVDSPERGMLPFDEVLDVP